MGSRNPVRKFSSTVNDSCIFTHAKFVGGGLKYFTKSLNNQKVSQNVVQVVKIYF